MKTQERLIVIGNGMVGAKVVEEILARDRRRFRITMFGDEPYGSYNRILLSNVLDGSQEPAAREARLRDSKTTKDLKETVS